jgi:hypothetical protein
MSKNCVVPHSILTDVDFGKQECFEGIFQEKNPLIKNLLVTKNLSKKPAITNKLTFYIFCDTSIKF